MMRFSVIVTIIIVTVVIIRIFSKGLVSLLEWNLTESGGRELLKPLLRICQFNKAYC